MSRYEQMFARCAAAGEGAFGAFLMLGDPGLEASQAYLDALVAGGADMVELGIPFSDPIADGPVIQRAAARALDAGVTIGDCLSLIEEFRARQSSIPIGILTYANIVAAHGVQRFAQQLARVGADSLLVADVPTLEAEPYAIAARNAGINLVMIAATNTPTETLARLSRFGSGYTYCVARAGVTGADQALTLDHASLFARLAEAGAPPSVLGFGIATPGHVAEAISSGALGVISGSVLVAMIERRIEPAKLAQYVASMKQATSFPENGSTTDLLAEMDLSATSSEWV